MIFCLVLLPDNSLIVSRRIGQESGFSYSAASRSDDDTQKSHPFGIGESNQEETSCRKGHGKSYTETNK